MKLTITPEIIAVGVSRARRIMSFQIVREEEMASINAAPLRDNRLSLAARGLYAVLAATPRETPQEQLELLSGSELWSDVSKLLKELASLNYISSGDQ